MALRLNELRAVSNSAEVERHSATGARSAIFKAKLLQWSVVVGFLVALALFAVVFWFVRERGFRGSAEIKLLAFSAMPALGFLAALFTVRLSPPEGLTPSRAEAPRLWAVVEDVCARAGHPVPTSIIIDPSFNACAALVPKRGLLPNYETHLVLGLQLLMAVEPEEAKAVIAHEIGHFARAHGKTSLEVAKAVQMVVRLRELAEVGGFLGRLTVAPFVLAAGGLVHSVRDLYRLNEFEADAFAASISGPETVGRALCRIHAGGHLLDVPRTLAEVREMLERGSLHDLMEEGLDRALVQIPSEGDSHPTLAARLSALALEPVVPDEIGTAHAAAAWLSDLDGLMARFDAEIGKTVVEHRASVEEQKNDFRVQLSTISLDQDLEELSPLGCPRHHAALLTHRAARHLATEEFDEARELLDRATELAPDYEYPNIVYAHFVGRDDLCTSIEHELLAAEKNPEYLAEMFEQLEQKVLYARNLPGHEDRSARLQALREVYEVACRERWRSLGMFDSFRSPRLSATAIAEIETALSRVPEIHSMTIVERPVTFRPDFPDLAIFVVLRHHWEGPDAASYDDATRRIQRVLKVANLYGSVSTSLDDDIPAQILHFRMKRVRGALRLAPGTGRSDVPARGGDVTAVGGSAPPVALAA